MKEEFLAGAAKVKITPSLGTRINGDFYTHYAHYIHDDLFARALVFKNKDISIAMVVVDICTMGQDFIDVVKLSIETTTSIPFNHILIASTHTHAAGSIEDVHLGAADLDYRKQLPELIVESVKNACAQIRPAKISFGYVDVPEHVRCRRYYLTGVEELRNPVTEKLDNIKTNPFGLEKHIDRPVSIPDPQLSYLAVKGKDERWISVLANYSLHYVGDWENGTITADYFGTFSAHLKQILKADDDMIVMMSNGTSGDVNIWEFEVKQASSNYFSRSKIVGCHLADKMLPNIEQSTWDDAPDLQLSHESMTLDVRKPSPEELEKARETMKNARFVRNSYSDDDLLKIYAREQILLNEFDGQRTCLLQVIKIGRLVIGALPGEFFAETGLWLKKHYSRGQYFTIGLANGNIGYVPPEEQFDLGGYETWRCRYSCLETNAEEKIQARLKILIDQIHQYKSLVPKILSK